MWLPEVCRTEIVRVVGLLVAVTARGERSLTLAALADLARRTEAVRVVRLGVAVTALGQTPTLDTLRPGTAGGGRVLGCRVAVTAGREGRLAGAVLQVVRQSQSMTTIVTPSPPRCSQHFFFGTDTSDT